MAVSQNKETLQYGPQNTIVLLIGTPKRVPLILGNSSFKGTHLITTHPAVSLTSGPNGNRRFEKSLGFRVLGFKVLGFLGFGV